MVDSLMLTCIIDIVPLLNIYLYTNDYVLFPYLFYPLDYNH